jgi:CTD kinase subunit alpha
VERRVSRPPADNAWPLADCLSLLRCIMLELFIRKPVFQGNDEIHQLEVIFNMMGTPHMESWPGLGGLPWYELVKPKVEYSSRLVEMFAS